MIKTRLHTVRFDTRLPYNCIFLVSSEHELIHEREITLDPRDNNEVLSLQDFPFFTQVIKGRDLNALMITKEHLLKYNYNPELGGDVLSTLRDIFPDSEIGCFVVRLLPYRDQLEDNTFDTLFVGELTRHTYRLEEIKEFAIEAARMNYERMTGRTWDPNNPEGFFRDRNWRYELESLEFHSCHLHHMFDEERTIKQERERIKQEYSEQFNQFSTPFSFGGLNTGKDIINKIIHSGYGESLDNKDIITAKCPIKILPKDDGYKDLFICPKDRKPILCNFGRGWGAKALYILFLRHPDGLYLPDLQEERYVKELALIYQKLRRNCIPECDDNTALKKAQNIVRVNNRLESGAIAVIMTSIRKWFNERFVPALAGDYAIEPKDERRIAHQSRLFGINIPQEMIDLGSFGFPFNPDL